MTSRLLWGAVALLWGVALLDALEPGQYRFEFIPNDLPALLEIQADDRLSND
ncbi:MAG: hypothetical protein WBG38_09895 [Nodosilinea sp.]